MHQRKHLSPASYHVKAVCATCVDAPWPRWSVQRWPAPQPVLRSWWLLPVSTRQVSHPLICLFKKKKKTPLEFHFNTNTFVLNTAKRSHLGFFYWQLMSKLTNINDKKLKIWFTSFLRQIALLTGWRRGHSLGKCKLVFNNNFTY